MDTTEIQEGNRLIAKSPFADHDWDELDKKPERFWEKYLCYHKDWNLLMQVVEKIEKLGYQVRIHGLVCDISTTEGKSISYWKKEQPKITNVFIAIIEFIKYHNQSK